MTTIDLKDARSALGRSLRRPVLAGTALVTLFFGAFGTWAAVAPLASAAIAPGIVSPDSSRKTVQHLEGGIIRQILVQEGTHVEAGQPLLLLDNAQAEATFLELQNQYRTFQATEARLLAEQALAAGIVYPDDLLDALDQPGVTDIVQAQEQLFATRAQALANRKAILQQRIAQTGQEIVGLQAQIDAGNVQLGLIDEEIASVSQMLDQGLERRPRLLALQRDRAQIQGAVGANLAAIARAEQQIGESQLEITNQDADRLDQIATDLTDVRSSLTALRERLSATRDVLDRMVITAPVSGIVVQLRYHTTGGVIGGGQPILDIVPDQDDLLVDARVAPTDIDVVRAGLPAIVHLSAFAQRNLPRIEGTVRTVSADSLTDPNTGQRYYLARVEVDLDTVHAVAPQIELVPGMPADVTIRTGERTMLEYLVQPFAQSLRRSFTEG